MSTKPYISPASFATGVQTILRFAISSDSSPTFIVSGTPNTSIFLHRSLKQSSASA